MFELLCFGRSLCLSVSHPCGAVVVSDGRPKSASCLLDNQTHVVPCAYKQAFIWGFMDLSDSFLADNSQSDSGRRYRMLLFLSVRLREG